MRVARTKSGICTTADCWNGDYYGAPSDGSAWTSFFCRQQVLRGGAWNGDPLDSRAAFRIRNATAYRYKGVGFRLARMLP